MIHEVALHRGIFPGIEFWWMTLTFLLLTAVFQCLNSVGKTLTFLFLTDVFQRSDSGGKRDDAVINFLVQRVIILIGEYVMEFDFKETHLTFDCFQSYTLVPDHTQHVVPAVSEEWRVFSQSRSDGTSLSIFIVLLITFTSVWYDLNFMLTFGDRLWQWRRVLWHLIGLTVSVDRCCSATMQGAGWRQDVQGLSS